MRKIIIAAVVVAACAFAGTAGATLVPSVFDPGSTGCPVATYASGWLHLEQNCATATNAAAGADITGIAGQTFTSGSFTLNSASQCKGGSPRFDIVTSDGTFFLGCNNVIPVVNGNGTATYTFDAATLLAGGSQVPLPTGTIIAADVLIDVQGVRRRRRTSPLNGIAAEPQTARAQRTSTTAITTRCTTTVITVTMATQVATTIRTTTSYIRAAPATRATGALVYVRGTGQSTNRRVAGRRTSSHHISSTKGDDNAQRSVSSRLRSQLRYSSPDPPPAASPTTSSPSTTSSRRAGRCRDGCVARQRLGALRRPDDAVVDVEQRHEHVDALQRQRREAGADGRGAGRPDRHRVQRRPRPTSSISQNGKTGAARFLFATEGGTILGWSPTVNGTTAIPASTARRPAPSTRASTRSATGSTRPTSTTGASTSSTRRSTR